MDTVLQPQTPTPALAIVAILLSALAITWLFRIWWAQTREHWSKMDGPERVLAAAVRGLPDARGDWGTAMMAELAQLEHPASRWQFALSCAYAAVFAPRNSGLSGAWVGAMGVVAAIATSLAMERLLPTLKVFAVTFVALAGALALWSAARSRRLSLAAPAVAVLVGVAGCLATTVYVVVKYPAAAYDPSHVVSVAFAGLLAGYLWLALTPPRALITDRWTGRIGVATALALHLVIGLGAPPIHASSTSDLAWVGGQLYMFAAITLLVLTCSAMAARIGRSRRAGVVAALWAGMVSALLVFPVFMLSQLHGEFNFGAYLRSNWRHGGMPDLNTYLNRYVGEELASCIVALVLFPAMAVLLGLVGDAISSRIRRASQGASWLGARVETPPSRGRISGDEPKQVGIALP
jgi:hypothetical protein